jgi:hypothetical protein
MMPEEEEEEEEEEEMRYLQNYKNIFLKCTTKLITFGTRRFQGDPRPCINIPLTSTPAVPEKNGSNNRTFLCRTLSFHNNLVSYS